MELSIHAPRMDDYPTEIKDLITFDKSFTRWVSTIKKLSLYLELTRLDDVTLTDLDSMDLGLTRLPRSPTLTSPCYSERRYVSHHRTVCFTLLT